MEKHAAYPGPRSTWSASTRDVAILSRSGLKGLILECRFLSVQCDEYTCSGFRLAVLFDRTNLWTLDITVSPDATLEFGSDGNLVLREANNSVLWSSNTVASKMELLETGNLVLYDRGGSPSDYVWQTFDQPIAKKVVTQQSLKVGQRLIDEMLGEQVYLEVQPHQVVLYDARFTTPHPYGAWISPGGEIGCMKLESNFSIALLDPKGGLLQMETLSECVGEDFGALTLYGGELQISCGSSFSEFNPNNQALFRLFFKYYYPETTCYHPRCGVNGICGRFELCSCPEGQVGNQLIVFQPPMGEPVECQPPSFRLKEGLRMETELMELPGVDHLMNPFIPSVEGLSLETCKRMCLQNTSCKGFSFRTRAEDDLLCQHADVLLLRNLSETSANVTTFIKVEVPATNSNSVPLPGRVGQLTGRQKDSFKLILVSALVAGSSALIGTVVFVHSMRRRRHAYARDVEVCAAAGHQSSDTFLANLPRRFSYQELGQMTSNFASKLGQGAFGSVYKGTLVAVKCLESERQGQEQFESEVMTIGSIHHKNLVKLLGFCVEKPSYYLVYELMANISLDKWLFENDLGFLDWEKRFNICLDIARGMSYLHQECSPPVLHLDVKPSNILLDESFHAKISDFGLARLADGKNSLKQAGLRGTPGYMAPEWLHGKVTEKADVFSFGIVLLEIVSSRRTVRAPTCMSEESLLRTDTVGLASEKGDMVNVLDKRLVEGGLNTAQAFQVIQVALECTREDPSRRPSMSEVVGMLLTF